MLRLPFAAALLLVTAVAGPARATIVERVVAIVGEHPILLSDVRTRAATYAPGGLGAEAAAQRSQLYTMTLERMIDEELLRRAASQAKVTVTNEEVDAAVERVAQSNKVTTEELLAEVERSGVSPTQYRRELRGQLLDAKVMNARMQGRVSVSPDDAREEYERLVQEERRMLPVQLLALRLRLPEGVNPAEAEKLAALANQLSQRAAGGESFEALVRQYASSAEDRTAGGVLPEVSPSQMPADLARAVIALEEGAVSRPILNQNTWVIFKLVHRAPSQLPSFEAAELQLLQRVQMRKMEKVRRRWLDDMRRRTHVEVRL